MEVRQSSCRRRPAHLPREYAQFLGHSDRRPQSGPWRAELFRSRQNKQQMREHLKDKEIFLVKLFGVKDQKISKAIFLALNSF